MASNKRGHNGATRTENAPEFKGHLHYQKAMENIDSMLIVEADDLAPQAEVPNRSTHKQTHAPKLVTHHKGQEPRKPVVYDDIVSFHDIVYTEKEKEELAGPKLEWFPGYIPANYEYADKLSYIRDAVSAAQMDGKEPDKKHVEFLAKHGERWDPPELEFTPAAKAWMVHRLFGKAEPRKKTPTAAAAAAESETEGDEAELPVPMLPPLTDQQKPKGRVLNRSRVGARQRLAPIEPDSDEDMTETGGYARMNTGFISALSRAYKQAHPSVQESIRNMPRDVASGLSEKTITKGPQIRMRT